MPRGAAVVASLMSMFVLLAATAIHAAAPVVNVVSVSCGSGSAAETATAEMTATDADGNLTSVTVGISEFTTPTACLAATPPVVSFASETFDFTPRGAASRQTTQQCTPTRWYRGFGLAGDNTGGAAAQVQSPTCCQCRPMHPPIVAVNAPALSGVGLTILIGLIMLFAAGIPMLRKL